MSGRENYETQLGFGCAWSLDPGCATRPWALFFNRFAVSVRLGVGTEWLLDGRAWRVVGRTLDDIAIPHQRYASLLFEIDDLNRVKIV